MDSAKQLEIVVPKYVEKVYIGQQRYNIKQITIQGLDTTLEGAFRDNMYSEIKQVELV